MLVLISIWWYYIWAVCVISNGWAAFDVNNVIMAINAGSKHDHVDQLGVVYKADTLKVGTSSDYGRTQLINRAHLQDLELYQVERYHTNTFGYDIPADKDGDYLLVMKFCEVYFKKPGQKVFNVMLNKVMIMEDFDINSRAGFATAHDEYFTYSIQNGMLHIDKTKTKIMDKVIRLEFLKGKKDNPKINAIMVYKGSVVDIPSFCLPKQFTILRYYERTDLSQRSNLINKKKDLFQYKEVQEVSPNNSVYWFVPMGLFFCYWAILRVTLMR